MTPPTSLLIEWGQKAYVPEPSIQNDAALKESVRRRSMTPPYRLSDNKKCAPLNCSAGRVFILFSLREPPG